jgi:hypothetical protein
MLGDHRQEVQRGVRGRSPTQRTRRAAQRTRRREFRVQSSEFRKDLASCVILNEVKDLHRSNGRDPSLALRMTLREAFSEL